MRSGKRRFVAPWYRGNGGCLAALLTYWSICAVITAFALAWRYLPHWVGITFLGLCVVGYVMYSIDIFRRP